MDTELKTLIEEQGKAWEEFKATNDEALKAKADGKAVSELDEKMGRINAELDKISGLVDEIARKQSRPAAPSKDAEDYNKKHTEAWLKWLRTGDETMLERLRKDGESGGSDSGGGSSGSGSSDSSSETTARYMNVGTASEGGYAVPIEQDKEIMRLKKDLTNILSYHTGRPYEQVLEDCDRDHYFSAQQAVEYGLIDKVLEPGKQVS